MRRHCKINAKRIVTLVLVSGSFVFLQEPSFTARADADDGAFVARLSTISMVASTVPGNGDVNPYGVAVVPRTIGKLVKDSILVSNFNNSSNAQGTGTTIVQVAPDGTPSLFTMIDAAHLPGPCPGGVGLTTALVALRSGWVIVGSLPTGDGHPSNAKAGCLMVLDSSGTPVATLSGGEINGPWDMTALERDHEAVLFVTNVLNGTVAGGGNPVNEGTILRVELELPDGLGTPHEVSRTIIGSGFGERTDPNALVIGPTGVGLGPRGTLYVADTLADRIAAIPNALRRMDSAGTGDTVAEGGALHGPLGLTLTPNNHILVVNGGDGNMAEITRSGSLIAVKMVDTTGAGAGTLFGLAIAPHNKGVYFVNDGNNTLNLLH